MNLENIKFGLLLASGAVASIMVFFATYYTLYEISLNKSLRGSAKLKWSALALLLPVLGSISYFTVVKKPEYSPVEK